MSLDLWAILPHSKGGVYVIKFRWQGSVPWVLTKAKKSDLTWDVKFEVSKWGLVAIVFITFFLSVILI